MGFELKGAGNGGRAWCQAGGAGGRIGAALAMSNGGGAVGGTWGGAVVTAWVRAVVRAVARRDCPAGPV